MSSMKTFEIVRSHQMSAEEFGSWLASDEARHVEHLRFDHAGDELLSLYFEKLPRAMPRLRSLALRMVRMPRLSECEPWPSLQTLRLENVEGLDEAVTLFRAESFPAMKTLEIRSSGQLAYAQILRAMPHWQQLESVVITAAGSDHATAMQQAVDAGLYERFSHKALKVVFWQVRNTSDFSTVYQAIQDEHIPTRARAHLFESIPRPLNTRVLYRYLKDAGAPVRAGMRQDELYDVLHAALPDDVRFG